MSIANTFDKGLKLLDLFTAERPKLTLRDVAEISGLSKPTALRLLNTLEANGYLMRDRSKAYCLGLKFLELGNCVAERLDIRAVALPHMEELLIRADQAVNLVIRDGLEAVYIEKRETSHPVRMYTRIGRRAPLYAGACPRALIAFLPEKETADIISRLEFKPYTAAAPTNALELQEKIKQERALGYCLSKGELYDGTGALAMPVRDYSRRVVASISISGPVGNFIEERREYLLGALTRCVDAISKDLGYPVQKVNNRG